MPSDRAGRLEVRQAKWLNCAERLRQVARERPDATLAELAAALDHVLSPRLNLDPPIALRQ